ncbi:unnamed protein product [Adineta ricciae]|uniref:Uncharacterized protein n=1 Tax=Adineta ricciae TaxID=249248 RepID=A0A815CW66_ADIRI|nr:unnamed protein product [Adineta ricciae]CAF1288222.1 unnamed protein product [Adineta ricciae]
MDDKRKQQSINNLETDNGRKRFAKDSLLPPKQQNESYQLLVKLLQEAYHLEHCLLNSYLYTACSIKSTPGEFEKIECIQRFVLYESTDALHDQDPFGPKIMALFKQLFDFEVNLNIESTLLNVDDRQVRAKLFAPLPIPAKPLTKVALGALPPVEELHFASIADFYLQGFPPVGPIYRSKNFDVLHTQNVHSYYRNVKNIDSIIAEIVDEGEGFKNFEERAEFLLDKVKHIGTREYLRCYMEEKTSKRDSPTKYQWLADCEQFRQSHLYRFAMIMMGMEQEMDLANAVNVKFDSYRQPIKIYHNVTLKDLTAQIPY